jgi:hypothetical protein
MVAFRTAANDPGISVASNPALGAAVIETVGAEAGTPIRCPLLDSAAGNSNEYRTTVTAVAPAASNANRTVLNSWMHDMPILPIHKRGISDSAIVVRRFVHANLSRSTSLKGQKQTFWPFIAMSALPPKADIAEHD